MIIDVKYMIYQIFPITQEKCYVHNIFITFSQQILNGRLLLIVMGSQKSNLSCEFKLKPIVIYCL